MSALTVVDRVTATDLMQLVTDVGSVPMQVGACLLLDAPGGFDVATARRLLGERVTSVPRLRRRLAAAPFGCGRPVWVDDEKFDLDAHLGVVRCPSPGDEQALLDLAADFVVTPLPRTRPLWAALLVTDVAGGRAGLVVVFHHVLADGLGGLAVLASLVDGATHVDDEAFPREVPSRGALWRDAWSSRADGVRRRRRVPLRAALHELGAGAPQRAAACSLNRATGPHRRLAVVRADLDAVRATAHRAGGTVNDVVLSAVAGAVRVLLESRGETLDRLVVSVMVSTRGTASADSLGNAGGVMPVAIPTGGSPQERLQRIAQITRARKGSSAGASAALLAPVFRGLGRFGVLRWFTDHQRMVHTFVTNMRGPDQPLTFAGSTVTEILPVTLATGNVTVAFAVLSYAGTLAVTVVADRDLVADVAIVAAALRAELAASAGVAS